jgi:hypothetical protein
LDFVFSGQRVRLSYIVPKLCADTPNESKIMKNRILSGIAFFTLSQVASAQGYGTPIVVFQNGTIVDGAPANSGSPLANCASGERMAEFNFSIFRFGSTLVRRVSGSDVPPAIAPRINNGINLINVGCAGQDSKNFTLSQGTRIGNTTNSGELFKLKAGNLLTVLRQGGTLSGKIINGVKNITTNTKSEDCYHVEFTNNTAGFYTSQYGAPVLLESSGTSLPDGVLLGSGHRIKGIVDPVTARVVYAVEGVRPGASHSVYTAKTNGGGRSVVVTAAQIIAAGFQSSVVAITVLDSHGGRVLLRVDGPSTTIFNCALVEVKAGVVTILAGPGTRNSIAPNASIADAVLPVCVSPNGGWQGLLVHSANYNRFEFWGRSDAFAEFPAAFTIGPYLDTPIIDPILGTTSIISRSDMSESTISDWGEVSVTNSSGILLMSPVIL